MCIYTITDYYEWHFTNNYSYQLHILIILIFHDYLH